MRNQGLLRTDRLPLEFQAQTGTLPTLHAPVVPLVGFYSRFQGQEIKTAAIIKGLCADCLDAKAPKQDSELVSGCASPAGPYSQPNRTIERLRSFQDCIRILVIL